MHQLLANRPMSGFPLSIGTSIAMETLFNPTMQVADSTRVVEHVDPSTYDTYVFNIQTLARNIIQSLPWRDISTIPRRDVADALLEEIEFLTNFFQAANYGVRFYWNSYSFPVKTYDKYGLIRKPTTPQQLQVQQLLEYCVEGVRKEGDVMSFSKDISFDRNAKCLLVSHVPWDLLSYTNFTKLDLLESHTGKVKTRKDWNSKYFQIKDKDFSTFPFMEYLLTVFGDSVMFSPRPLKERMDLYEVLIKKRVHPLMSELSLGFILGHK